MIISYKNMVISDIKYLIIISNFEIIVIQPGYTTCFAKSQSISYLRFNVSLISVDSP